jgi:hypothetical protein
LVKNTTALRGDANLRQATTRTIALAKIEA